MLDIIETGSSWVLVFTLLTVAVKVAEFVAATDHDRSGQSCPLFGFQYSTEAFIQNQTNKNSNRHHPLFPYLRLSSFKLAFTEAAMDNNILCSVSWRSTQSTDKQLSPMEGSEGGAQWWVCRCWEREPVWGECNSFKRSWHTISYIF